MGQRIAIGGLWHETNTFARGFTRVADFSNYQLTCGEDIFTRYTGTNTELGGVICVARELDLELLPTLYAGAIPSATIEKLALEELTDELIERLCEHLPIDGALMSMHGAAVAQDVPDADAYVLARVRAAIGPQAVLVATYDFHANLSESMVDNADLLVGYDTFPHIDMAELGREAGTLMSELIAGGRLPARALRRVPVLTVPQMQATDQYPGALVSG